MRGFGFERKALFPPCAPESDASGQYGFRQNCRLLQVLKHTAIITRLQSNLDLLANDYPIRGQPFFGDQAISA